MDPKKQQLITPQKGMLKKAKRRCRYKVFLSYRRSQAQSADMVRLMLEKYLDPQTIFQDKRTLLDGDFSAHIKAALQESECFVLVVTPQCFESDKDTDYFFDEIKTALDLHLRIIPVVFLDGKALQEDDFPPIFQQAGLHLQNQVCYSGQFEEACAGKLRSFITGEHAEARSRKERFRLFAASALLSACVVALVFLLGMWLTNGMPLLPFQGDSVERSVEKLMKQASLLQETTSDTAVGVGIFPDAKSGMLTPCSEKLRYIAEQAVRRGGARLVDRYELNKKEDSGELDTTAISEPGGPLPATHSGLDGVLRGRYTYDEGSDSVKLELELSTPRAVQTASLSLPLTSILPEKSKPSLFFHSQNEAASQWGIRQMLQESLMPANRDIDLHLKTVSGERVFIKGQSISFRLKASQDCYVAVICHQSDGHSVLLFPNADHDDMFIPANTWVDIPGTQKPGFQIDIDEPFGSDLVQVLACSKLEDLKQKLPAMETRQADEEASGYNVFSRGMVVKHLKANAPASSAVQWGETHLIISSYPERFE